MSTYLETVKNVYKEAAENPQKGLCCTTTPVWQLPGLKIPDKMLEMNYGCGSTVNPRDLANDPSILYVGVGGGWTSARPTGSAIIQVLGYVTKEGNGGQGVVLNSGPANLPNILSGSVWVGNSGSVPTAVPTSSLSVASAVTASYAFTASYIDGGFY